MGERLRQQRLAGGEVVVHEGGGHAGVDGDASDPHVVDPVGGDPVDRSVEDPLARHLKYASATSRSKSCTVLSTSV